MWFIGVEVEQEMSAPPPKQNPGSAPASVPSGSGFSRTELLKLVKCDHGFSPR